MTYQPRILLTNDDGIEAPGLKCLWEALADVAELLIVAPSTEKSAVGLSITIRKPLQIQNVPWEKETSAWRVNGTPADCVRLGLSIILKQPPDLIVSGINRGANSGRNVLYSGTIGGVIEGTLRGIPGIAFSCASFDNPAYSLAKPHISALVRHVLANPLPKGTLLNVNFPTTPTIRGVKMARQGRGYWIENPSERSHPEGHSYYWLGSKWDEHEEHIDSDVSLLNEGYAAVVPLHVDEMTNMNFLEDNKELFNSQFLQPL